MLWKCLAKVELMGDFNLLLFSVSTCLLFVSGVASWRNSVISCSYVM